MIDAQDVANQAIDAPVTRDAHGRVTSGRLNPSGLDRKKARMLRQLEDLTPRAIARLGRLVESENEAVALGAVREVLDRNLGKAKATVQVDVTQTHVLHLQALEEIAERKRNQLLTSQTIDAVAVQHDAETGSIIPVMRNAVQHNANEAVDPPPDPLPPGAAALAPTPPPIQRKIDLMAAPKQTFINFIDLYGDDPVGFVKDVLKAQPQVWQEEFLRAVARGERRISIRAGHGVGKSTTCSWALIWHMVCRYPQKGVVTAPTAAQLFDALFAELKSWINKLPPVLRDSFEVFSDKIVFKAAPESSFISARTSSSERPEALAGVHSEHVLLVVDEASAVPEAVFEAAAGSMSGHSATTILISNPTRNSGLFYKTHHQLASDWFRMHVSCINNPLVTEDFVRQIAATYGESSNAYRIRVLGEFALADDDTLIPAELVDAAIVRDVTVSNAEPMVYGVDVARFGTDRTALCKRRGNVVVEIKSWGGLDLMQTVGVIVNEAKLDRPDEICVDTIGLGSGVADRLREQGYDVRDVNVAESSAMNPNASRLRDELWMSVKDWLATRAVKLPKDEMLRMELVAPRYNFTSSGKLVVESKDSLRKRGMRSPDLADSLCLTFAGTAASVGGRAPAWKPGKPLSRGIRGVV